MSNELQHEATYIGKAALPRYGKNVQSGKKEIRLFMEIVEGPLAGRQVKWTANLKTEKSTSYARRDMLAAGWKGVDIATFERDVTDAAAAGLKVPFTARLAVNGLNDDGTPNQWWTVGSIGVSAAPLAATNADDDRDVNEWLSGGSPSTAPSDDSDLPF